MAQPRLSWPNRITVARILCIIPFVIAMLHMNTPRYTPWARYAALIIFSAMAISDVLDGFLARRLRTVTSLGTFLDPLADKLLITTACLLLTMETTAVAHARLPATVVVIIIGKDLYTVLGFVIIYLIAGRRHIVPATAGKACTALQCVMVLAILIHPEMHRFWPAAARILPVFWWAATATAIMTVLVYTRNGARFLGEYEQRLKNHDPARPPDQVS